MSELNSRGIDDVYIEYYNTGKHELAQVYLKSEVDKVIAHQKYKRCLALADYCYTNVHCIMGHRLCALADWKKNGLNDGTSVGWNLPRNSRREHNNASN